MGSPEDVVKAVNCTGRSRPSIVVAVVMYPDHASLLGAVVGGELDFHELGPLPLALVRERVPDAVSLATFREPSGEPIDRCVLAAPIDGLNRLLVALRAPVALDGLGLQVSGSIGVTFSPRNEELDPEQLLRQADAAMYNAKLQGRSAWRPFPVNGHEQTQAVDEDKMQPAGGGGL